MIDIKLSDSIITFIVEDEVLQQKLSSWFNNELTVDGDDFYFVDNAISLQCESGITSVEALLHFVDTFVTQNKNIQTSIMYVE